MACRRGDVGSDQHSPVSNGVIVITCAGLWTELVSPPPFTSEGIFYPPLESTVPESHHPQRVKDAKKDPCSIAEILSTAAGEIMDKDGNYYLPQIYIRQL